MLRSYLPAIVFVLLGGAVGTIFAVINSVLGPRRRVEHKQDPYECGLPSEVKRGMRFGISFYLIAMLFILFDIEIVFLYPLAVILHELSFFGFAAFASFLVVLVVAYVYIWRKGALEWR